MKYLLLYDIEDYPDNGGGIGASEYDTIEECKSEIDSLFGRWGDKFSASVYCYLTRSDTVPKEVTTVLDLVPHEEEK